MNSGTNWAKTELGARCYLVALDTRDVIVKPIFAVIRISVGPNRNRERLKMALAQSAFLGRKRGLAGGRRNHGWRKPWLKIYPLLSGLRRRERLEPDG